MAAATTSSPRGAFYQLTVSHAGTENPILLTHIFCSGTFTLWRTILCPPQCGLDCCKNVRVPACLSDPTEQEISDASYCIAWYCIISGYVILPNLAFYHAILHHAKSSVVILHRVLLTSKCLRSHSATVSRLSVKFKASLSSCRPGLHTSVSGAQHIGPPTFMTFPNFSAGAMMNINVKHWPMHLPAAV